MLVRILELVWMALMLAVGPLNVILTRRLVAKHRVTRAAAYASTIRGLSMMGLVTLVVDLVGARSGVHAFSKVRPVGELAWWTGVALIICFAVSFGMLYLRKRFKRPVTPLVALLLPQTSSDRVTFAGVSLTAGLVEEYVLRGFCLGLLISATGSRLLPFLLVTLSFGIGHGYQDLIGTARATLLGAVLALPVLAMGALLPAVIAHVLVDLASGLPSYHSLLHRWNLLPDVQPASAPPT